MINLPMSVTATTDAAKLTVLLHNCCLHMGISIIVNQELWASCKNCWVNCTVTQEQNMKRFLSGLKIGRWTHNKKLKIKSLNQKTIICAFILYVWRKRVFSQILCCWKLINLNVRIKSPWVINNSKHKAILDRSFFNCACNFHSHSGALTLEDN